MLSDHLAIGHPVWLVDSQVSTCFSRQTISGTGLVSAAKPKLLKSKFPSSLRAHTILLTSACAISDGERLQALSKTVLKIHPWVCVLQVCKLVEVRGPMDFMIELLGVGKAQSILHGGAVLHTHEIVVPGTWTAQCRGKIIGGPGSLGQGMTPMERQKQKAHRGGFAHSTQGLACRGEQGFLCLPNEGSLAQAHKPAAFFLSTGGPTGDKGSGGLGALAHKLVINHGSTRAFKMRGCQGIHNRKQV